MVHAYSWPRQSRATAGGLLVVLLAGAGLAGAEQLPVRIYTTGDGLARDQINRIVRDDRGFLWFCTPEGLSRFDGYQFTTYTTKDGLPHRSVRDLVQTRRGVYWVATGEGLCRFNPAGAPRFVVYHPGESPDARNVMQLLEDRAGAIWVGSWDGLYRMEPPGDRVTFRSIDMGMPAVTMDDE